MDLDMALESINMSRGKHGEREIKKIPWKNGHIWRVGSGTFLPRRNSYIRAFVFSGTALSPTDGNERSVAIMVRSEDVCFLFACDSNGNALAQNLSMG
jgi:hypothetical protein